VQADAIAVEVAELGDIAHPVWKLGDFLEELGTGGLGALEHGVQFAVAVEVDDGAIGGRAAFDLRVMGDSQGSGRGCFMPAREDGQAGKADVC
jgi:hypothetical protein